MVIDRGLSLIKYFCELRSVMISTICIVFLCLSLTTFNTIYAQQLSVKTNAIYWATGSVNLGGELGLRPKTTLDFVWGYNNWSWRPDLKWKHWLVMPEFRYYLCERFNGHFFGIHALYTQYNIGGVPTLRNMNMRYYRYEGWAVGAGITYGYQWILSKRWNIEALIGVGVVYTEFGKYLNGMCGAHLGDNNDLFVTPTKLAVNFIYMIK